MPGKKRIISFLKENGVKFTLSKHSKAYTAQRAAAIMKLAKNGIDGDVEYMYWVEWDDIPGIPVAITDNRIEPIKLGPDSREQIISRLIEQFGEFKKIVRMSTGEAFKVPTRDIIEKGIQEQELDKYPKWED